MNPFNVFAKAMIEKMYGRIHTCPNGYVFGDGGTTNGQGDYPVTDRGAWVPMKVCRKCPHHLKRRRGQPYPCCTILRDIARKGPSPAEQVNDLLGRAVAKTNEILKG